jgi:broad specificity phosphatase PhoE
MAMPNNLVMVRHGQSEANIVQQLFKADPDAGVPDGFLERHDTHMRLSALGIEQAAAAGKWLLKEFPEGFDRYYASPLVRTRETAGRLAIDGVWRLDDRWRERDWGEYAALNDTEQKKRYELSHRLRQQHKWYWCPPGGESLATGVRLRFEDILDTAHREVAGQNMIAVSHGETISVARYVLERMDPDEWLADDKNSDQNIENCQILHYTRTDPVTGEMAPQLRWMRSVCPWDSAKSWQGGEWFTIPARATYTDEALLKSVDIHSNLFESTSRD